MNYYHDIITEKSWQKLQKLRRLYNFILIGGWAVYIYTKSLKSKDIDFICDYETLQKLKESYDLVKNDRLKKYEIHAGEFDIDIYTPFFSDLGIPVEDLIKLTREVQGFTVLAPEALLILKQIAYKNREGSEKGDKDKIDIIALLNGVIDIARYRDLLKHYGLTEYRQQLKNIFKETRRVPELDLSEHAFANLKKTVLGQL